MKREHEDDYGEESESHEGGGGRKRHRGEGDRVDLRILLQSKVRNVVDLWRDLTMTWRDKDVMWWEVI